MRWLGLLLALAALGALGAEKYSGPVPPKPDMPYLLHADNLVETEGTEARQEKRRNDAVYVVTGATSPARTPLAEPIFLMRSEKIMPQDLELYRLEVRAGNRESVFPENKRNWPRSFRLVMTRLDERLYRIEVSENLGLENGEYLLTPRGSNQVFCFTVY
jgi:hypothetical protein